MEYLYNATVARLNDNIGQKVTAKNRIKMLLVWGRGQWICGTAFLAIYQPTYSQRIGELIYEGATIERGRCTDPAHTHKAKMGAYRWEK